MSWRRLVHTWRSFFGRSRMERDLEDELAAHVRIETERRIANGEVPEEARIHALRDIRSTGYVKEHTRDQWAGSGFERLHRDVYYAVRVLAKARGFTTATILIVALGIGASVLIFTVLNAVLLKSLPYDQPDRIVQLWQLGETGNRMSVPEANFLDWQSEARSFEHMAAYAGRDTPVLRGNDSFRIRNTIVTGEFFDVFGVEPVVGRLFEPSEMEAGASPVAVLSYSFWQQELGAPERMDGLTLAFANDVYDVVGVLPAGFTFPATQVWTNRGPLGPVNPSRSAHNFRVVARLRPGVAVAAASAELDAIAARIHDSYADVTGVGAVALSLQRQMSESYRVPLIVLMAAVSTLLLIASVNLTTLSLARSESRRRELAVRTALGASRWHVGWQMFLEGLLPTAAGGVLGIAIATAGTRPVLALLGVTLPSAVDLAPDLTVLLFAMGITLMTALAVGLVPAVRLSDTELADAMKIHVRGHGGTGRIRGTLLVGQVALTLVLLVAGTLLARSLERILEVDLGFRTENLLVVDIAAPFRPEDEASALRLGTFHQTLADRIAALPGVVRLGGVDGTPLSGSNANGRFQLEGGGDSGDYWPAYRVVSPGYFDTLGIPLLDGRLFDDTDRWGQPGVAVISRRVAEEVFPGRDAIGRRINFSNMDGIDEFTTIVGIVEEARYRGPEAAYLGSIYFPYTQRPNMAVRFEWIVEGRGDSRLLGPRITALVRELDPQQSVRLLTMDALFASSVADRVFNLSLVGAFAAMALALTTVGIYGLIAYGVNQRVAEIGIRKAVGASASGIVWLFVRAGGTLVATGAALGIVFAIAVTRVLQSLLFEVDALDVISFVGAAVALFAPALIATVLSARRATHVDPMEALREG